MFCLLLLLPFISFLPFLLVGYLTAKIVSPLVTAAVLALTVLWAIGYRQEKKYRSKTLPELEELLASLKSKPAKSDEKLRKLARWLNVPSPVGIYDEDTIRAVKELLASASGRRAAEVPQPVPSTPTSRRSSVADGDIPTPNSSSSSDGTSHTITTNQPLKDIHTKALFHELALRTLGPANTRRIMYVKNRRGMLEFVIAEKENQQHHQQGVHPLPHPHSHCQGPQRHGGGRECIHGRPAMARPSHTDRRGNYNDTTTDNNKNMNMKFGEGEDTRVHFNVHSIGEWDKI